jgi:hypothetical protein
MRGIIVFIYFSLIVRTFCRFVCGIRPDPENPPVTFGTSRCLSVLWSSLYKCLLYVVSEGIDVGFWAWASWL